VGLPKTGTTFLQSALSAGRRSLRDQSVLFHWPTAAHFWAAQDLTEHLFLGQENPRVPGAWAKLARKARRWSGTSVISHELFTLATDEQARRAAADLAPAELHVVLTIRDYERQLPAVWQERLKNGGRVTFERHFAQAVEHDANRPDEATGFWRQQDAVGILGRWSRVVPRDRIHVITIPQPGAPRDTLWRRFAEVVGFSPDLVDLDAVESSGNVSLRPPEAQLLRRINARLPDSLPPRVYRSVVKKYLAEAAVASGRHTATYALTEDQRATTRAWSGQLREVLETGGYHVVGSPQELVSTADLVAPTSARGLDDVSADEQAAAAVAGAAALVHWMAEAPDLTAPTPLRALVEHVRGRS
jgi:hypothetical protein